jgi:hypothetical protein
LEEVIRLEHGNAEKRRGNTMNILRIFNIVVFVSAGILYYDLIVGGAAWAALAAGEKAVGWVLAW